MRPLRIQLIVTGEMEQQGLHHSFQKVFGGVRAGVPVEWSHPHKTEGMTSSRLSREKIPGQAKKLARTLLNYVAQKEADAPALVMVVDDLELYNRDQPEVVATLFQQALEGELSARATDKKLSDQEVSALKARLRTCASFHLFQSMPENYYFNDPVALEAAGVAHDRPRLVGLDLEAFETCDETRDWLQVCTRCDQGQQNHFPAWKTRHHAKKYLEYLVELQPHTTFVETRHSLAALKALSWERVTGGVPSHTPILRALFQDLADWFQILNPLGEGHVHPAFYRGEPSVLDEERLLRNM